VFVTIIGHNGKQITINLDQLSCITNNEHRLFFYFSGSDTDYATIKIEPTDSALDFIGELMKCKERYTIFDLRTP